MFIFNVKLNGKLIYKIFLILVIISIIILFGIATYKVFNESIKINDNNSSKIHNITSR